MALGLAEAKGTLVSPLTAIAAAAGTLAFTLRHHEESRIRVRHEQIWGLVRVTMADAANSISHTLWPTRVHLLLWGGGSWYPKCPSLLVLQWDNSEVSSTGFLRRSQNIKPQLPIAVTWSVPLLLQTVYLKMGRLEHLSTPLYLVLNWLKFALGGVKVLLLQMALACPTKALGRMQKNSNTGRLFSRHEVGHCQCEARLSPPELSSAQLQVKSEVGQG